MNKQSLKILIIEDSAEDRTVFRHFLLKHDPTYIFLENELGEAGIETCLTEKPDCVLLDYNLPDTDGLTVIKTLNPDPVNPVFPVILLTGEGSEKLAVEAIKNGAQDYLVKGKISAEELALTVHKAIEIVKLHSRHKKSEKDLNESEARYRSLFELAAVGIARANGTTGRFEEVNDEFCRITGYSREELISLEFPELTHPDDREADREMHRKLIYSKENQTSYTKRYIRKDGQIIWVRITATVVRDVNGKVEYSVSIVEDITENRAAEVSLRESEERFRKVADNAPVMIWVTESDGICTYLNQSWYEFTGQTPVTGLNFGWLNATHPDDKAEAERIFLVANERREAFRLEYRLRRKDGEYRWAIDSAQPRFSDTGSFLGYIGSVIDISDRKEAELEIKTLSDYNRSVLESITDPFFTLDTDYRFTYMSSQGEKLVFREPNELIGKSIWDEFPGLSGTPFEKMYRDAVENNTTSTVAGFYPDHDCWYEVTAYPSPNGATVYFKDISERKRTELNLIFLADLQSEFAPLSTVAEIMQTAGGRLFEYLDLTHCLFVEIDESIQTATVLYDKCAADAIDLGGVYDMEHFHTAAERQTLGTGKVLTINNIRDGARPAEAVEAFESLDIRAFVTAPFINESGWKFALSAQCSRPRKWRDDECELLQEITARIYIRIERARAEQALRESEERFRTIFDSIDEGFCIIEMIFDEDETPFDYRFVQANPAFTRLTGFPEDALGKTARELVPDLEKFWSETYGKVVLTGESVRFENQSVSMNRWFEVYASRVGDKSSRRVALVFNNITERKKAEAEIETANFRFRVAESAVKGFNYEWNLDSGEVTRSESFERVTGYRREEIEESWFGWADLIHPDDSTAKTETEGFEFINNLVEDSFGREYRIKHKQGHYLWVLERGVTIRDAQGKISRVIGQTIDITDRKETQEKLLEAERRAASDYRQLLSRIAPLAQTLGTARELSSIYRALLEFIRFETPCEGFFISFYEDENQLKRVKYVWCEGAELDADQLKPITLGEGANSRAIRTKKSVAATRHLDKMNGEFEVIGKDDRSRPVYSLVTPMIVMGRVIGTIETQNHEQEYVQENIVALEMAANLAAVAIENVRLINIESKARTAAEEANRSKDEFLAVLSHELRTPLNSIKGWVSMLQNHDLDEPRRNQAVEVISRNVNSQNALIEDILDVSRIISGKMRLETERISFVSVVQNVIDALRPIAEKKSINLIAEVDALADEMNGDAFRLQQIINNLLNNAVKFTPEGGVINVRLERFGDTARLTVADTGIGIEPELLPRIFDRFQQADGTSRRKYNGLGLGLAIVKHLTELHGGAVFADSAGKNKGTIFTVELPLISQMIFPFPDKDEAAANDLFEKSSLLAGLKLLIVDDEPDTLEMMRFALRNFGAEVASVNTARKALEKLSAEKFDALISDVGMAEMDGCDLIRHIREKFEFDAKTLPAIALSGYVSADDRERSLNAGFQKHLGKPVDVKTLPHEIKALIEK